MRAVKLLYDGALMASMNSQSRKGLARVGGDLELTPAKVFARKSLAQESFVGKEGSQL